MKKMAMTLFLLLPIVSFAGETCKGVVSQVGLSSSGDLHASVQGTDVVLWNVDFCNVHSDSGRYHGNQCQALMALLLSASAQKQEVSLSFNGDNFKGCGQSWNDLGEQGLYYIRAE